MRRSRKWIGGILLVLAAHEVIGPFRHGRWVCTICGASEVRTQWLWVPLWWTPVRAEYHDWFERNVGLSHEHDWAGRACTSRGFLLPGAIGCGVSSDGFFQGLPHWDDQPRAIEVARRLASMDTDRRRLELRKSGPVVYWLHPHNPDAAREFSRWRRAHPVWHDLIPEP